VTTVLAIAAAVLAVSLLIVVHEAGHYLAARRFGMRVERFSIGFGPVLLSFRRGDTEFAISALPLGGYVKILGMAAGEDVDPADRTAYANQAPWRRFLVILAGPAMNYVAGVALAAGLLLTVGLSAPDPAARVGRVVPGMPAAHAGLRTGDRVVSVAGTAVDSWEALVGELKRHPGVEIPLVVERTEGSRATHLTLTVTPRNEGGFGLVGFDRHRVLVARDALLPALAEALSRTNALVMDQVAGFKKVFSGGKGAKLSGPVGIAEQLVLAARDGTGPFLTLVWFISVVLAVLNLFPIPALDGGRLIFLGYEIVSRRRVNARVENALHLVGFIALLALILMVTVFGDLARLRGR
jgi:regulator of sigma E protease